VVWLATFLKKDLRNPNIDFEKKTRNILLSKSEAMKAKLDQSKVLILLADDDKVDRTMLRKALKPMKAEVTEVSTGGEVLRTLQKQRYDCLVLDYMLPDYDGLKLVREIRNRGVNTPVVVITGHGDELLAVKFLQAGAQDYIPKAKITEDLLCQAVVNAIRLKESMDERQHYRDFYEKAPVGFYTTDLRTGRFVKGNPFLVNFFGFDSLEELRQHDSTEFYPAEQRQQLLELIKRQGQATDFEISVTLPNGEHHWAIVTSMVSRCGKYLEGSLTDITERKQLEAQLTHYQNEQISTLRGLQDAIKQRVKEM
jgi:PAS domain S-box-containing protein